jgi:hypothetical protein
VNFGNILRLNGPIPWFHHLEVWRQIDPKLKAVPRGVLGCAPALCVFDARSRAHPLHATRPNDGAVAEAVGVATPTLFDIREDIESSVRMPSNVTSHDFIRRAWIRRSLPEDFLLRHFAPLIIHQKGIYFLCAKRRGPGLPDLEALVPCRIRNLRSNSTKYPENVIWVTSFNDRCEIFAGSATKHEKKEVEMPT